MINSSARLSATKKASRAAYTKRPVSLSLTLCSRGPYFDPKIGPTCTQTRTKEKETGTGSETKEALSR